VGNPYAALGVAPNADAATIRARYLELVQRFTPEHHPAEFARHRAAYERIKDADARVQYHLFGPFAAPNLDGAIALAEAAAPVPPRPTLAQLLAALPKSHEPS
jgi:curved DNA-binding protein CbpA